MSIVNAQGGGGGGGGTSAAKIAGIPIDEVFQLDQPNKRITVDYSFRTSLNSMELGEMHTTSSGGENIFFKNNVTDIDWFPVWQGLLPYVDNDTSMGLAPSYREYNLPFNLTPNGAIGTGNVSYKGEFTLANSQSIISIEVAAGEDYTGELIYYIKDSDHNGKMKFEKHLTVNVLEGDSIVFDFGHHSETHKGQVLAVNMIKEDGTDLLVKSGSLNTSMAWVELKMLYFKDIPASGYASVMANSKIDFSFDRDIVLPWEMPDESEGIIADFGIIKGEDLTTEHSLFIEIDWEEFNSQNLASDQPGDVFLAVALLTNDDYNDHNLGRALNFSEIMPATYVEIELLSTGAGEYQAVGNFEILNNVADTALYLVPRGAQLGNRLVTPGYYSTEITQITAQDALEGVMASNGGGPFNGEDRHLVLFALNARGNTVDAGTKLGTLKSFRANTVLQKSLAYSRVRKAI